MNNEKTEKKWGGRNLEGEKTGRQKIISASAWAEVFSCPVPQRKEEFLNRLQEEYIKRMYKADVSIGIVPFMLSQIVYIRKRVYAAAFMILAASVMTIDYAGSDSVEWIAAMMPFAAVCLVTEGIRSKTYGMAEMELSSRFSLRSILLARCGAVGFVHMILLSVLIMVLRQDELTSVFRTAVYLLVPYLAACAAQLAAVRRLHGRETTGVCLAVSVMVSLLYTVLKETLYSLYGARQLIFWVVLAVWLIGRTVHEYKNLTENTEAWV